MKHLLKLLDLSEGEIIDILNLADQLKYEKKHNISREYLKGKSLGMIFQKSSTRLKQVCINSADRRCFCRRAICRSEEANL